MSGAIYTNSWHMLARFSGPGRNLLPKEKEKESKGKGKGKERERESK